MRVVLVSEDERAINEDAMLSQICQRLAKPALHRVEALVHRREVLFVETLEPDQYAAATRAMQFGEEFLVMRRIDAHLRDPADVELCQLREQRPARFQIGREVVVDEKENALLFLQLAQFPDDVIDFATAVRARVKGLNRTEFARKPASAPRLDESDRQIPFPLEQSPVDADRRQRLLLAVISPLQCLMPQVVNDPRPNTLGLPRHDRIGI